MQRIKDWPVFVKICFGIIISALSYAGITVIPQIVTQAPIQSENSESETTELINVEIIVLDSGENLPIQDVEVRVVSTGGPEVRRTNTDGFVQIEIPTRDDVGITLAKDGFQTSRHSINLKNDPNRTREYYLVKE
ncbi:hypothetical protein Lepto7376_3868 [[Leptolyngbya] sp. PCC 7376]|nr:hypothetical protein Lepto7376_3868 [[Leptolyngbya] sp. PCC 7376]